MVAVAADEEREQFAVAAVAVAVAEMKGEVTKLHKLAVSDSSEEVPLPEAAPAREVAVAAGQLFALDAVIAVVVAAAAVVVVVVVAAADCRKGEECR